MTVLQVRFRVRLTPRAGGDRVDGVAQDGTLLARVAPPPADGAANTALLGLLAHELGRPRTAVSVVAGARGRRKTIGIEGMTPDEVLARWPGLKIAV
jgi:uncharacterized protein